MIATGCKESRWTPMGSAELVLSEIKLGGAPAVSRRIDSDESFGQSVMDGIATGDSLWLEVAQQLTPASAAAEASLAIALASALTHSPARVLALLGDKYPVEEVCGMPFLKADSLGVVSYYDSAAKSLQSVDSTSLRAVRDSCRIALDGARQRRLDRINPGYLIKNKPVSPPRRVRKRVTKRKQPVTPQDTSSSQ
ncbi:MAG TPA: hypothetical protein VGJ47_06250 [Gemmatimonadaceae bacterium]